MFYEFEMNWNNIMFNEWLIVKLMKVHSLFLESNNGIYVEFHITLRTVSDLSLGR